MHTARNMSAKSIAGRAVLGIAFVLAAGSPVLAQRGGPNTGPAAAGCLAAPCPPDRKPQKSCECTVRKMKTATGTVYVKDCYYMDGGFVRYCKPSDN